MNVFLVRFIVISLLSMLSALGAVASEREFKNHSYVQVQLGVQHTLGENSFSNLNSLNSQIAIGYQFSPVFGTRLAFNGWESKGSPLDDIDIKDTYKWNYIASNVDLTLDITNMLAGYNARRKCSFGIFLGVGANFAFNNEEAIAFRKKLASQNINTLSLAWENQNTLILGQLGANVDFKISDRVALGIELSANVLPDAYNSKKADNADWYFNALVGVKVNLSKSSRTKEVKRVKSTTKVIRDTVYVDRVIEKEVVKTVMPTSQDVDLMRRDIFFKISSYKVDPSEAEKVQELAEFLISHPKSKLVIYGYADEGTGNKNYNLILARQRSESVAKMLETQYRIPLERIIIKSMDESMEQPYSVSIQNRVSICVIR